MPTRMDNDIDHQADELVESRSIALSEALAEAALEQLRLASEIAELRRELAALSAASPARGRHTR